MFIFKQFSNFYLQSPLIILRYSISIENQFSLKGTLYYLVYFQINQYPPLMELY